jgi:hypothetical protein
VKQIFVIDNKLETPTQPILILRMGDAHVCYAVADKANNTLHQLYYYEVETWSSESLANFWNSNLILQQQYFDVRVAFDFKKSSIHSTNTEIQHTKDLLAGLFGNLHEETIITEGISGWPCQNIYTVPQIVKHFVEQKFPSAKWRNQFSVLLLNLSPLPEGIIRVDFRQHTFTMAVCNDSHLLLTQTFEYATPEDVLYQLLKCCQQFSLSQQTVRLHISGLIDKDSALYKELYLYFIQVDFCEISWNTNDGHPAHFFTSLNELFLCAS